MIISAIVAMARNRVIGHGSQLPWDLPDEMRYFMKTTRGHHVIMGRKTYDTMGCPLPNRTNLVVSRQRGLYIGGCVVLPDVVKGITTARGRGEKEVFVIGGAEIYRQALPFVHRLYLTTVEDDVVGDVFFPEFDVGAWQVVYELYHAQDNRHPYAFTIRVLEPLRPSG